MASDPAAANEYGLVDGSPQEFCNDEQPHEPHEYLVGMGRFQCPGLPFGVPSAARVCLRCGNRSMVAHGGGFKCRDCGAEEPGAPADDDPRPEVPMPSAAHEPRVVKTVVGVPPELAERHDAASAPDRVLVVIALTTTNVQAAVEERLRDALLLGGPNCEAQVYAKRVDELVAADLDALAVTLGGWQAVSRLRVGDVAAGGFSTPLAGAASGDGAGPLAADDPDTTGCPTCGGDGLDDDFHDCLQCDGSGQVPVEPEVERGY